MKKCIVLFVLLLCFVGKVFAGCEHADRFQFPFLSDGYSASGLSYTTTHPGEDWNYKTGNSSDMGHSIYSIANGEVIAAKDYGGRWGKIVLIEHTGPDYATKVWSQYAHNEDNLVKEGDCVRIGQEIATIGDGNGYYEGSAHLHFEIRKFKLAADKWTQGSDVKKHYYNPSWFIQTGQYRSRTICSDVAEGRACWVTRNAMDASCHRAQTWYVESDVLGKTYEMDSSLCKMQCKPKSAQLLLDFLISPAYAGSVESCSIVESGLSGESSPKDGGDDGDPGDEGGDNNTTNQ
ncbi:MAG: M23 family metallopeptidase, partial [Candidatus Moranbacteria bacterium]|nr:M23 family metallopeptidase [Candidatus Moranbacteria bacterium]